MKTRILLFFSILTFLTSCNGQTTQSVASDKSSPLISIGDTVKELGKNIMLVFQDTKNNYWFGSWETGVYKYDGKTLINYTTKHGLYNDRVDDIKEDKSGNIYFTGMNPNSTITKFDGKSFTNIRATPSNEWKLEANDLWLLNAYQDKQKVYRFDGNTFYELTIPKPPKLNNPFEVYSIYRDIKGNIWFGTNPVGVCRYDGKSFDWITEKDVAEIFNKPDEGANGVRSIIEDKNGDFWFNTEYRYTIYDNKQDNGTFYNRIKSIGNLDGKDNSNLNEYLSITKDNDNNLWIATYNAGVWKYDGTKITHYPVQINSKDITLFSIYTDNNGNLWLGTHENGALKFNGKTFEQFVP